LVSQVTINHIKEASENIDGNERVSELNQEQLHGQPAPTLKLLGFPIFSLNIKLPEQTIDNGR
jgi:hypothetical protein